MAETKQKSAQEVELDLIFAEEFECDPGFAQRYIELLGLDLGEFEVNEVVAEPQWENGNGYGDLKVTGMSGNTQVVLLIEHKINANAPPRQAARYLEEAKMIRNDGTECHTVMAAPRAYVGEKNLYDKGLALEDIKEAVLSDDQARQEYRRSRIQRAIDKKGSSGSKTTNKPLENLHDDYRATTRKYWEKPPVHFTLDDKSHRNDSWVWKIKHKKLPPDVYLRHRLWEKIGAEHGFIDLIKEGTSNSENPDKEKFKELKPDWAEAPKTSASLAQICVRVCAFKADQPFNPALVAQACKHMDNLVDWYLEKFPEQ